MDVAPSPVPEELPVQARDWSLLPLDVLSSSVFVRVGAVDVLMGAGLVCHSWLQAAKVPDVWRVLDMENHDVLIYKDDYDLRAMAKAAVDRSDGQLRVFAARLFVSDELLKYILERSPSLATLRLVFCCDVYSKPLVKVIRESPPLELRCLDLDDFELTIAELTAMLENCPLLEVLRVRNCLYIFDQAEHELRSKFARIKTMTFEVDDDFRFDSCFYDDGDRYDYFDYREYF
ncbi:hypothetical protein ACQ4PT_014297 [Festuca glaucescens]